jgi:hypothetical protein
MKVTGYSRSQIKRLIQQFVKTSDIKIKVARRNGFTCRYTLSDIRLLAEMDERHQQPSGALIKKHCKPAYQKFEQDQYKTSPTFRFYIYTIYVAQRPINGGDAA